MLARSLAIGLLVSGFLVNLAFLPGQDAAVAPAAAAPPKGVEVLARGPVHEAFASLTAEPSPAKPLDKRPPKPLEEMPPDDKPEGDVQWIGGYWAWDEDRSDYLWVSGTWRTPPPGKQWIAGYWREDGDKWQWVGGFWTAAATKEAPAPDVTYLPAPPAPPEVAPPAPPPADNSFWVPGTWVWNGARYAWRAGYWARVEPGYVWVAAHYRWTPGGYLYVSGYWDLAVSRRGVLYAPVYVDPAVVTVSFSYTPAYAVHDTLVLDTLFVRPAYGHYYFGDYYGPVYRDRGFESVYVYSARSYDPIIVYERYEHRRDPAWFTLQVNLYNDRYDGRAAVPPRTFVQQTTVVNNVTNVTNVTNNTTNNITNNTTVTKQVYNGPTIAPATQVAAAKGVKTVALDTTARQQVKEQIAAIQQVAVQRTRTEASFPTGAPTQPRVASLVAPKVQPDGSPTRVVTPSANTRPTPGAQPSVGRPMNSAVPAAPSTRPPATVPATGATTPSTRPTTPVPPAPPGSGPIHPGQPLGTAPPGTTVAPRPQPRPLPPRPDPSRRPPPKDSKDGKDGPNRP